MNDEQIPTNLEDAIVESFANFTNPRDNDNEAGGQFGEALEEAQESQEEPVEEAQATTEERAEEVLDYLEELARKYPEYFEQLTQEKVNPRDYIENLIKLDIQFRKDPQAVVKQLATLYQIAEQTKDAEDIDEMKQVFEALNQMSKSYYEALFYLHEQYKMLNDQFNRSLMVGLNKFLSEEDPRGINRIEMFKNDSFRNQLSTVVQALMNQDPYIDFSTALQRGFDILLNATMPQLAQQQPQPKPQVNEEFKLDKNPEAMNLEDIVSEFWNRLR